jgi:hypothetical protein
MRRKFQTGIHVIIEQPSDNEVVELSFGFVAFLFKANNLRGYLRTPRLF